MLDRERIIGCTHYHHKLGELSHKYEHGLHLVYLTVISWDYRLAAVLYMILGGGLTLAAMVEDEYKKITPKSLFLWTFLLADIIITGLME